MLIYTINNSMIQKYKFFSIIFTVLFCYTILLSLYILRDHVQPVIGGLVQNSTIIPSTTPVRVLTETPKIQITLRPKATPTPAGYTLFFVDIPLDSTEGNTVPFTWRIEGLPNTIHTTSVYYGLESSPGNLSKLTKPSDTKYSRNVKDFMNGDYSIPLQFVGSGLLPSPGTYYARIYALINGEHIWSEEVTFSTKPLPKYEIKIINPPEKIKKGENIVFTWEVSGPSTTTTFTTIAIGTTSKSGNLDYTVDIPHTPYQILVKDFTNGSYNIPLRFIGNAVINDSGKYYYRVLAFVNSKNIWSDEYELTVE